MIFLNFSYVIIFSFKNQINSSLTLIFLAHDYLCAVCDVAGLKKFCPAGRGLGARRGVGAL